MNDKILGDAYRMMKPAFKGAKPFCGLILGSGLSAVVEAFKVRGSLEYSAIPALGAPGVAGHAGKLVWAEFAGLELIVVCGRRHWYEGLAWEPVAAPIYLLKRFNAKVLVLTNAAGAVDTKFEAGDLMVIDDHINLMGANPLAGPHDPFWGPRFPDQSCVYDAGLRKMLHSAGKEAGVKLRHGVYLAAAGPAYETPAEVAAFRAMGAHAVGMSTAPEATLASAAGLRVAGISCTVNAAMGHSRTKPLSHEEVTSVADAAVPRTKALLLAFLRRLAKTEEKTDHGLHG